MLHKAWDVAELESRKQEFKENNFGKYHNCHCAQQVDTKRDSAERGR